MQKMRGPDDEYCPLWKKPMSKVCHTCPWWEPYRGKDRNTEKDIDEWKCAIAIMPKLLIENTAFVIGVQQSTESMRNEMAKAHIEGTNAISHAIAVVSRPAIDNAIDVTPRKRLPHDSH